MKLVAGPGCPGLPLAPGVDYQLRLPQGVASSLGTVTGRDFQATFTVSPEPDMKLTTEPGEFDVWLGGDSTAERHASFRLTGSP